jgi:SHS2 domain-containing protein
MIGKSGSSGFVEVDHTADWALRVWAERLDELFKVAASGMYSLLGVQVASGVRSSADFRTTGIDPETFLVGFLSELLYHLERDRTAFDQIEIRFTAAFLEAHVEGALVISQSKEIKAVTYHNLKIRQINGTYETTIVFDV